VDNKEPFNNNEWRREPWPARPYVTISEYQVSVFRQHLSKPSKRHTYRWCTQIQFQCKVSSLYQPGLWGVKKPPLYLNPAPPSLRLPCRFPWP